MAEGNFRLFTHGETFALLLELPEWKCDRCHLARLEYCEYCAACCLRGWKWKGASKSASGSLRLCGESLELPVDFTSDSTFTHAG